MNYYQHHIGDFIRDTSRLTDAQCMAYLRMLWMYYETEEPLQCEVDSLAFKIGASASDVQQILKHFFFEHEGKWHNARCDREILAFRKRSEKAKESANARWENAKAMRTHSERSAPEPVSDANQEPITNNQYSSSLRSEEKRGKRAATMLAEKPTEVSDSLWTDFLAIRKAKKAPLTETALQGIEREAAKAGMGIVEVLEMCCTRGWQSFKADWASPTAQARAVNGKPRVYHDISGMDYTRGVDEDGRF